MQQQTRRTTLSYTIVQLRRGKQFTDKASSAKAKNCLSSSNFQTVRRKHENATGKCGCLVKTQTTGWRQKAWPRSNQMICKWFILKLLISIPASNTRSDVLMNTMCVKQIAGTNPKIYKHAATKQKRTSHQKLAWVMHSAAQSSHFANHALNRSGYIPGAINKRLRLGQKKRKWHGRMRGWE